MSVARYLSKFAALLNSSGQVPASALQPEAQYYGYKNRIINGAFEVWQRGNTSRTFAGSSSYSADRWTRMGYQDGAHERVSVASPVAGMTARYALRVTSATTGEASGGSRMDASQKIESVNCFDLAGQNVTISFWVRFSAATISSSTATAYGNFTMYAKANTTTTDSSTFSDLGDVHLGSTTITNGSLPTVWTKYTMTVACPSGMKNICARFTMDNLGNTASAGSAWYEITEVQLEKGSTATSFDYRPYGTELQLCQRYYQRTNGFFAATQSSNELNVVGCSGIVVPMRAAPTTTLPLGSRFHKPGVAFYAASSISGGPDQNGSGYCTIVIASGAGANTVGQIDYGLLLSSEL